MDRTIKTTGTATASAAPDLITFSLGIEARSASYQKANSLALEKLEKLRKAVISAGFEKSDLKTAGCNISAEYDSFQDGNRWKRQFAGYRYRHDLKLTFDMDMERLNKALSALSGSEADTEISIIFSVKNGEEINKQLLSAAVKDAREKADILAAAAGVSVGKVISIDSTESGGPTPLRMAKAAMLCADAQPDIVPQEVTAVITVIAEWEIE